jgi:hypothetical protein
MAIVGHDHIRLQFDGGTKQGTTVADDSDRVKLCFAKSLA